MSGDAPKMTFGTQGKISQILEGSVYERFAKLDQGDKIAAEYVWLGGTMADLRSKTKTLTKEPQSPEDLPHWNYDGSSTDQAPDSLKRNSAGMGHNLQHLAMPAASLLYGRSNWALYCAGTDSEVLLVPRAIYKDPFRGAPNILVMCDTYKPPQPGEAGKEGLKLQPLPTNSRCACAAAMEKAKKDKPWFGIEQEYTLLNSTTKWPLGWPANGFPGPQGPYYCAAGAGAAVGREIVEAHLKACYYAGINLSGVNAEVMPSQWEYQVGPCEGTDSGDQLWMSRYILLRLAELYNIDVTFDPKPVPGDWNGAGGHTNYSNEATRKPGSGWDAIQEQIKKLEAKHALHIASYGEGNERRLTGKHETSSMHEFSWGVANRGASIRVGRSVPVDKCGYYEDRRPSSNLDPYVVTRLLVETTLL